MPVFSQRVLVARKEHRCRSCDLPIYPGERYTRMFGQAESYEPAYEIKLCSICKDPDEASKPIPDGYDYIRTFYKVSVVVGQTVECEGIKGTVVPVGGRSGNYLSVKVQRPGRKRPQIEVWHPTWETVYYKDDGTVAADYRKQKTEVAV